MKKAVILSPKIWRDRPKSVSALATIVWMPQTRNTTYDLISSPNDFSLKANSTLVKSGNFPRGLNVSISRASSISLGESSLTLSGGTLPSARSLESTGTVLRLCMPRRPRSRLDCTCCSPSRPCCRLAFLVHSAAARCILLFVRFGSPTAHPVLLAQAFSLASSLARCRQPASHPCPLPACTASAITRCLDPRSAVLLPERPKVAR
mmetsp:Transcript_20296/g.36109  ORF Transcript_20296/g.36109 Transcript_20296/m.36109 type:complete len:206 (-) Transcript_20296:160-777(-)